MSAVHAVAVDASSHDPSWWQWPMDLTRYDRTPTLTPAEVISGKINTVV